MKHLLLLALALGLFSAPFAFAQTKADAILGTYWTPKKNGKIQISKRNNLYYGKIIEGDKPNRLDTENPKPELRTRKVVGFEFLTGFKFDGDDQWVDGNIYDPDNGKTYSCKMWQEGRDLQVRGYVGTPMVGRTKLFKRIK
jgi:uncharacterized protein (DUF2147 family)